MCPALIVTRAIRRGDTASPSSALVAFQTRLGFWQPVAGRTPRQAWPGGDGMGPFSSWPQPARQTKGLVLPGRSEMAACEEQGHGTEELCPAPAPSVSRGLAGGTFKPAVSSTSSSSGLGCPQVPITVLSLSHLLWLYPARGPPEPGCSGERPLSSPCPRTPG